MPESQRLHISQNKDVHVVEFVDHKILDEANIKEIGDALQALIGTKDRPKVVLDFVQVDHLSSAALGMLINLNAKIKQQSGQLRLVNIKPQILEVFVITQLNKVFKILPNQAEALSSFSA